MLKQPVYQMTETERKPESVQTHSRPECHYSKQGVHMQAFGRFDKIVHFTLQIPLKAAVYSCFTEGLRGQTSSRQPGNILKQGVHLIFPSSTS